MKKKSLSANKIIHKKLLTHLKDPIINKSPRKDVSLRLSFVINEPNNIELKAIDRSSLETINPT